MPDATSDGPPGSVARQRGNVAKVALKQLKAKTGKKVISQLNARSLLEKNNVNELKQGKR